MTVFYAMCRSAEAVSGFIGLDVLDPAASRADYDVRDLDTATAAVKDTPDSDAKSVPALRERAQPTTAVTDDSGIHLQGNWPAVTAISFVLINRSPFIRRVGCAPNRAASRTRS